MIIIMMTKKNMDIKVKVYTPDEDLLEDLETICSGELIELLNSFKCPEVLRQTAAYLKNVRKRIDALINATKAAYEAKALEIELHDRKLEKMSKESLIAYIKDLEKKLSASA